MAETNLPSQLKPSPMSLGLQEQLYEPWVLMQEAFRWHSFILKEWASLHSSMSERQCAYHDKIKLQWMSLQDKGNDMSQ